MIVFFEAANIEMLLCFLLFNEGFFYSRINQNITDKFYKFA